MQVSPFLRPSGTHHFHLQLGESWLLTLHPSGPRRQGLGILCYGFDTDSGQVPSLSPLPLPTVPGFPRHGAPTISLSFPLIKEMAGTAAGHSGRTSFMKNSRIGGRRRRERRGRGGGDAVQDLYTCCGSWTKTSFPGKAGHVLIPGFCPLLRVLALNTLAAHPM